MEVLNSKELRILLFHIAEGEGNKVYNDVTDVEFCVKLAEDLRDGDYGDGDGVGGRRDRVCCV